VYTPPQYGAHIHAEVDDSTPLDAAEVLWLQEIVGCMLFYARAVDSSMLTAVNHISSVQAKPTRRVMVEAERLLQYAAAYPSHELVLSSDMILYGQSDASYLSRAEGRSVAGGLLFCGDKNDFVTVNGAILAISCITRPCVRGGIRRLFHHRSARSLAAYGPTCTRIYTTTNADSLR